MISVNKLEKNLIQAYLWFWYLSGYSILLGNPAWLFKETCFLYFGQNWRFNQSIKHTMKNTYRYNPNWNLNTSSTTTHLDLDIIWSLLCTTTITIYNHHHINSIVTHTPECQINPVTLQCKMKTPLATKNMNSLFSVFGVIFFSPGCIFI